MKMLIATAVLAAILAGPAFAGDDQPKPAKVKNDPDEMICKVQQTTAGIPTRTCATRRDWQRENERTRQEMMMTQRPMCGIAGGGC